MHLAELVETGVITVEMALANTNNPSDLQLLLRGIGGRGGKSEAQRQLEQRDAATPVARGRAADRARKLQEGS
jgi:hypothetical protein